MIDSTLSAASILAVEGLRVRFGTGAHAEEAVRGLSFAIAPGETLAIVGESGSGKTVSALAALGLIGHRGGRVTAGRALFRSGSGEQVDLLSSAPTLLRRLRGLEIGMVFQEPMSSLNPVQRIGDQISEAARVHLGFGRAEARELAEEMLVRVRIPDAARRLDQYPHELSGGMRQRAMIAMALACRPRLLIADEPTTALDVTVQAEILSLIKHLQKDSGTAVLFITHDLGVVAELGDRVVVMRHGVAVEAGDVATVLTTPEHPYSQMLLSAVPALGKARGSPGPMRIAVSGNRSPAVVAASARPAADLSPLLRVERLTKRFTIRRGVLRRAIGTIHAVEDVSFEIARGRTLSLVGESGCGKTTTGRCILRLLAATSGRVLMEGTDIMTLPAARMSELRRNMQIVFQDPYASLNPRRTAGQLVGEPAVIHAACRGSELADRVEELFRRVGLAPELASRYPHEFSGGQRQRVCIARALCLNPRLIVADEPVSALDVSIRAQIINLMIDLQEELALTYLFISHDMAVVERMSHHVAVMRTGRIVEIGPRDAVLGDPVHPYTRRLIDAVPNVDPHRRRVLAELSVGELASPMLPPGVEPLPVNYRSVGPDHLVAEDNS